jgi:uncharacterized membrane protein
MSDNEWACGDRRDWRSVKGMSWRVTVSAVSALGWFGFVIAWLFFLADGYSILQNIAVLMLSVVALAIVNVTVWLTFAQSMGELKDVSCEGEKHGMAKGALALIWLVAIGVWLFWYAGDYSLYQNLAMLLLSIVPVAAVGMLLRK